MRTEKIEAEYINRVSNLIRRAETDAGHIKLDALQIAQWLIARKDGFSKSTWRHHRSSLVFVFKNQPGLDDNSDVITAAIYILEQALPPVGRPVILKTAAQKQKKITYDDLFKLQDHIDIKNSRT